MRGDVRTCRRLLGRSRASVNQADSHGRTPLLAACMHGCIDVCRLLVTEGGADVNQAKSNGTTPLLVATARGHKTVVRFLLRHGAQDTEAHIGGRARSTASEATGETADYLAKKRCGGCGSLTNTQLCGGCGRVSYCSRACQKKEWRAHKPACQALA